ncbi:hypothetical protein [Aeromicrobium endophyticum]|uniref:hypothetical protein n=1 Tax=Aeromicrobium endophyticum TaxID=2292704 RepID=UPI001314D413|nr:hypothetical protein [Aeromicrobium endophyticum]
MRYVSGSFTAKNPTSSIRNSTAIKGLFAAIGRRTDDLLDLGPSGAAGAAA